MQKRLTKIDQRKARRHRRGVVTVYGAIAATAIIGFASFAVDVGRIELAKSQLQDAADAAARYAAQAVNHTNASNNAAAAQARSTARFYEVQGQRIDVDSGDVQLGWWDEETRTFEPRSNANNSNAVRVELKMRDDRSNALPLVFGGIFGVEQVSLTATSIAYLDTSNHRNYGRGNGMYDYYVPATSNVWLAGMPPGTASNPNNPRRNPDFAGGEFVDLGTRNRDEHQFGRAATLPGQGFNGSNASNYDHPSEYNAKMASPIKAGGVNIQAGQVLNFDGVSGGASNHRGNSNDPSDGGSSFTSYFAGAEHGKSDIIAPYNSLIAVFIGDGNPANQTPPSRLDFSTSASRDFDELRPQVNQVFFIGDGKNSAGELQRFVVPEGATRLYLGTMDGWEWNNNAGGFDVAMSVVSKVRTVR